MQLSGIVTGGEYRNAMSDTATHLMLKAKISAIVLCRRINLFDSDGRLIKLVGSLAAASRQRCPTGPYFRKFKSDPHSPLILVDRFTAVHRRLDHRARPQADRTRRRMPRSHRQGQRAGPFRKFFASVALGDDSAISMFHRDGTLLARYPHVDDMIGGISHQARCRAGAVGRPITGRCRINSPAMAGAAGSVRELTNFPIVMIATTTGGRPGRLGGTDPVF